jgi:hypothetical protein
MAVGRRRAHNSSPKTIRLDPVREPGQFRVSEQFLPASNGVVLGYEFDLHFRAPPDSRDSAGAYRLLGPYAPLIHASKPESRYVNNIKSYRDRYPDSWPD